MDGLNGELIVNKFKDSYHAYIETFNKKMPQINQMSRTVIALTDDLFDQKRVDMPKYLLAEAKIAYESGEDKTLWGYYNSLTYAITHKSKKPNPELAIKYGIEAWRAAEEGFNTL